MSESPELQRRARAAVGRVIADRYALERVLGVGGMGAVFEAVHVVTQRRVAVKVLHRGVADGVPTAATRFFREAQAAASIGHPGIADVLDAGRDQDGALYLVLELLRGEDLDQALTLGRLTLPEAVGVIVDVLDPLAAAHAKGFIHRDIKPANVFLAERSEGGMQVKLLDFGIVKPVREAEITASGALLGTVDYMSPEQIQGEALDGRADLWGVGATLFHALSGHPPFRGRTRLEVLRKIVETAAPPLEEVAPHIPGAVAAVVDRSLRRRVEERFGDARQMQAALRDALRELEARARAEPAERPGGRAEASAPEPDAARGGAMSALEARAPAEPRPLRGSERGAPVRPGDGAECTTEVARRAISGARAERAEHPEGRAEPLKLDVRPPQRAGRSALPGTGGRRRVPLWVGLAVLGAGLAAWWHFAAPPPAAQTRAKPPVLRVPAAPGGPRAAELAAPPALELPAAPAPAAPTPAAAVPPPVRRARPAPLPSVAVTPPPRAAPPRPAVVRPPAPPGAEALPAPRGPEEPFRRYR